MRSSRRRFLKSIGAALLANGILSYFPLRLFAKTDAITEGIEITPGFIVFSEKTQRIMLALAETLVPWAKEIEFTKLFMEKMKGDHGLAGAFDAGLWNLNANSIRILKKPFYELETVEEKKKVIDHIIDRNYQFYTKFRRVTIEIVFSNPTAWKRISYNGPPQPRGFMDYTMPPKSG
jgi:hypothetical protein